MESGDTYAYTADRLGHVIAVTHAQTGAIKRYIYSPYGVELRGDESGNPFRYTGRRYAPETGLYYYRARYYDTDLGPVPKYGSDRLRRLMESLRLCGQ